LPEKGPVATDADQILVLEFFEMMDRVEAGISNSSWMSPTTNPWGWAAKRSCIMRTRGSAPIAANISA
jgi:hypothetical protein